MQEVQERASRLPDHSVEQIFVRDEKLTEGNKSALFTVRTAEKATDLVQASIDRLLGPLQKKITMEYKIGADNKEATLTFSDEASPAQVTMLLDRELQAQGLKDPSQQFALSRLDDPTLARVPMGVFREVSRPTYDDLVRAQIAEAQERAGGPATDADLAQLLSGHDTWTVEA